MPSQPLPDEKPAPGPVFGLPTDRAKVGCREVAKLFAVSAEHVRRLCASGQIAADPVEGRSPSSVTYWSIPVPALADFVRRRMLDGTSQPPAKPKQRAGRKPAAGHRGRANAS